MKRNFLGRFLAIRTFICFKTCLIKLAANPDMKCCLRPGIEMSGSRCSVKLTLLRGTPMGMGGDCGGEPPGEPGGRFTDRPTSMGSLKVLVTTRGVSTIIGTGKTVGADSGAAAGSRGAATGEAGTAPGGASEPASATAC
jgi:hypothetical protein